MSVPTDFSVTAESQVSETVSGWRLPKHARQALLAIHVTLACIWIGALVVILLLVGTQIDDSSIGSQTGLDRAILLIFDTLVVNASYGFVVTGLLFSLFTHWGAFRFWWVTIKWALLGVLGIALPIWVAPHISGVAALSDAFSGDVSNNANYARHANAVFFAAFAQTITLVGIVAVSIIKPWGRRTARYRWPKVLSIAVALLVVFGLAIQFWVQNVQLKEYRQLPIPFVDVSMLRDGTYEGSEIHSGFTYRVQVVVAAGRVTDVDILTNRDSHYARLAALVTERFSMRRDNEIDAISGATTTSKALIRAASNALEGEPRRDVPE